MYIPVEAWIRSGRELCPAVLELLEDVGDQLLDVSAIDALGDGKPVNGGNCERQLCEEKVCLPWKRPICRRGDNQTIRDCNRPERAVEAPVKGVKARRWGG